jgi:hypothetical protein
VLVKVEAAVVVIEVVKPGTVPIRTVSGLPEIPVKTLVKAETAAVLIVVLISGTDPIRSVSAAPLVP